MLLSKCRINAIDDKYKEVEIVVDVEKLKREIKESGQTVKTLAANMGIDVSTLYRKLQSGGESFTVKEASQMTDILSLNREKAKEIFFGV